MIVAPYDANRKYDIIFENIINDISQALLEKEDDFLLLCCGSPGTGKSRLMLWGLELCLRENANVKYLGLNRADFADSLNNAKKSVLPRFCSNDEANISKRDSNSTYNKDVIDLYFSIRGLQIFHWWNNPSLDIIDKKFIEDIKKDLQELEVGELIENPVSKELEFHFGGEQYSLGVSNKRETK